MKQVQIKYGGSPAAPRVNEDSFYPNIDPSYTEFTYYGDRLAIHTRQQTVGIKRWTNLPSGRQGMAIYGNRLFRMSAASSSTTHYVYSIGDSGTLTEVGSFTCSTSGHSNALQFAPTIEGSNAYPYLYVSDTDGSCIVLQIASDYTATQVQKITVAVGWQVLIGDDGYIWAVAGGGTSLRFIKYRKVPVSEGATVALTSSDIIDEIVCEEQFDSSLYTFQGAKFKFGKAWLPIGTDGSGKKRALFVYDLAAKRTLANIDLSVLNVEFEDCDFWDNALIIACYEANTYILRF